MSAAPERIWAAPPYDDPEWKSGAGEWDVSDGWAVDGLTEYVRADTVQAQIDAALAAAIGRQTAALLVTGPKCECGMTGPCMWSECKAPILAIRMKGAKP